MRTETCAVAFLSWGRWVAACPRPGCSNAEMRGRCDDGTTGGVDADRFTCRASHGGCGFVCGVTWPATIAQIEALVLARPVPATRNWYPGEDLHDLLAENLAHGIVPTAALEGRSGLLLSIVGDEITAGALESAARPQLEESSWRG